MPKNSSPILSTVSLFIPLQTGVRQYKVTLTGCRVSPECFGHMTSLLSSLAEGRVVLALEGGYNLTTISYCMALCAKALLGDPLPPLEPQLVPNKSAVQTINDVIHTHSRYWSALCFQVCGGLERCGTDGVFLSGLAAAFSAWQS